ncbi:MAG: trigger factor [Silicimonas sp.]|nr:trigger factor [Silicimonas sp.]
MAGLSSLWALNGEWHLSRRIVHGDGSTATLEGKAVFARSGPRLIQDETGILTLDGSELEATQRYVWERAGPLLQVYFSDMRPFHAIPLNVVAPEAVHLCAPDRYEVAYDFENWPFWRSVWRVEGPRKDYVMTTTYDQSGREP